MVHQMLFLPSFLKDINNFFITLLKPKKKLVDASQNESLVYCLYYSLFTIYNFVSTMQKLTVDSFFAMEIFVFAIQIELDQS